MVARDHRVLGAASTPRGGVARVGPWMLLGILAAALIGCEEDARGIAQLDGPSDIAVLPAGAWFEVPVGFVVNSRSGRISKLDLKRGGQLVEDQGAPWVGGFDLALGDERLLSQIALWDGGELVHAWVSDDVHDDLIRVPALDGHGPGGAPIFARPSLGALSHTDAGGQPVDAGAFELRQLRVRPGRAAEERWTITWDGRAFSVHGTASGLQRGMAIPGTPYESDRAEIAFVPSLLGASPAIGVSTSFDVVRGIESAPAGGLVLDLWADVHSGWIVAAVLPEGNDGFLGIWDAETFTELSRVALPAGAVPERLAAGRDLGTLWIADSADLGGEGRVLRLRYLPGDLHSFEVSSLPVPEPGFDVAEGRSPSAHRLFAASAYSDSIWMLDPKTGDLVDANVFTTEVDAISVRTPTAGLTETPGPVETAQLDEDGSRFTRHAIAVATFGAEMFLLDAETGCQFFDSPAGADVETSAAAAFTDVGSVSDPQLVADADTARIVTTHPCGGVTRTEVWTLRFDAWTQDYEVEGSRSGVQVARAREGERYWSDTGAISFLILPGTRATTDGDSWTFPATSGLSPIPLQELPADPVVYTELFDDRDGRWFKVRTREVAIVPHTGNDVVLWIDLQGQGKGGIRAWQ